MLLHLEKIFADHVSVGKRRLNINQPNLRGWGARNTLLNLLLVVFFFLLSVRLFHLTVVDGPANRELSEDNRIKTITIHAPRGIFYDRRGETLVKNIPAFRLTGPCEPHAACPTRFILESEWEKSGLSKKSVYLEKDFFREYVLPNETAHVLGYLSEISEAELANPLYTYQDYLVGDRLGRTGLEAVFENKMRGTNGKELIEINAAHDRIRTLGKIDPLPGIDIHLSLDADLQKIAFESLGENPGAVVVTQPKSGEILALISTPSFNTNKLHAGLTASEYENLLKSVDRPMFNRALSGVYPPGSIFKIVSAIAGLESKSVSKSTLIEDIGILRVGEFSFSNWYFTQYGGTEGSVDIVKAIARSNDIYFYKLGEATGIAEIAAWGKRFGIGAKTSIELFGEAEGVMPDEEYQKKVRGTPWYLGDSYHIAIGQGDLQTTPLQVNRWTNAIASGGVLCPFTLLKSDENKKAQCVDLGIKKENLDLVIEGMRRACYRGEESEYQGTGWPLFDFTVYKEELTGESGKSEVRKVPVACKTGTAEFGDPNDKTHAWFTAFAPLPNQTGEFVISGEPEIVVTVLLEKGGEGSTNAGPIAKKILEEWFKR